ncbi:MAG: GNAT family N-acetyltransferase [Actinobacteria bacterium]|nr:GNAT family N-acetyltransferase [Actinomycetota bacterium]
MTGDDRLLGAAAANLAAWHTSSVAALGLASTTSERWWTCALPGPTIFHSAISLRPSSHRRWWVRRRHLAELRDVLAQPEANHRSVCDSWNELDLTRLGLSRQAVSPWCAREARPPPQIGDGDAAAALAIEVVRDRGTLLVFERTMAQAFEVPVLIPPFGVHAPPILDDPSMQVLLGRVGTEAVSIAMTYRSRGVLGVYGVGTVPDHRGNGYATAMVRHILDGETELPATLQPSQQAETMYRKLGFRPIGRFAHWV